MQITDRIKQCQLHLAPLLLRLLPTPVEDSPLFSAMHYACLNGGKRLRPLLVYCSAELFGAKWQEVDHVAAALEFIHCYSLIHDDLPSMDNDDLRRGKPTCHKVYNEAIAILAGDALLTLAFEVLATSAHSNIIKIVAQAAGTHKGMLQGQALDLAAQTQPLTLEQLIAMHQAKTGALIRASVQCGALTTQQASDSQLERLHKYGEAIGLAFQIQDDILDAIGDSTIMGKHSTDAKNNKCTFVTLLGLAKAREYAQIYHAQALDSLSLFGPQADPLRDLSTYIIERVA